MNSAVRVAQARRDRRFAWSAGVAAALAIALAGSQQAPEGDAKAAAVAPEAAPAVRLADRTLVPRRIRLIIGFKRPRIT